MSLCGTTLGLSISFGSILGEEEPTRGFAIKKLDLWMTRKEELLRDIWRSLRAELRVVRELMSRDLYIHMWRTYNPNNILLSLTSTSRSLETLKSHFQQDILRDQDPWETDEKFDRLLQLLPNGILNESLRKKWSSAPGRASSAKWADIDALAKTSKGLDAKGLLEAKQDIVLEYTYPRLDIEVSKKLNHLLKSPFVVHPGTGRVCVPIDTRALDDFDPLGVPTVMELLAEIDNWTAPDKEEKSIQDWEKTSLKPYVEYFRSFVLGLMKDEQAVKIKREQESDTMEF